MDALNNSPATDPSAVKPSRKTSWPTIGACCVASLIVPVACIGLAMGLLDAEPELDIYRIWAPDTTDYADDKAYLKNLQDTTEMYEPGLVPCLFKSIPRGEGSHLRQDNVLELVERMKAMEAVEVTHKDSTYTYNDACYSGANVKNMHLGYTLPCFTMAAVHSYRDGGWEMEDIPLANMIWYQELLPVAMRPLINYFLLAMDFPPVSSLVAGLGLPDVVGQPADCIPATLCDTYAAGAGAAAMAAAAANGSDAVAQQAAYVEAATATQGACCIFECKAACALGSFAATSNGINPQAYEDYPVCMQCMGDAERKLFAKLDVPAYATLFGFDPTSYGDWQFSTIHDQFVDVDGISYKDVWLYTKALGGVQDSFVNQHNTAGDTFQALADAALNASDSTTAAGYAEQAAISKYTATVMAGYNVPEFEEAVLSSLYNMVKGVTNTFTAEATSLGFSKGLQRADNATEEELHGWASEPVSGWNPVVHYPFEMIFGRTTSDENGILTDVEGLQAVYFLADAKHFKEKVASPMRAYGPLDADGNNRSAVTITEDDAEEILTLMKTKMEEVWTANWDQSDSDTDDVNKYVALTGGNGGTFHRALKEMTEDSLIPSVVSYGAIVVVSVLLMFSPSLTESKMLVSLIGALFSIVAFSGALGLTVLMGSKMMFTSAWTLPFLLVGLGVDDMYVILTTLILEGGDTATGFAKAMKGCLVPVTMTSVTNAAMFGMLMFASVPAVREVGKIAMTSIGLQYLAMVTAFPCICFLDMIRSSGRRLDCLCCVKGTRPDAPIKNLLYKLVYKPVIGFLPARIVIILLAVAAVVVGVIGSLEADPGGDLKDFFQPGTVEYEHMVVQEEHFDISWPLQVNFGELDYNDPEVQMHMIDIYEKVIATPYSTKVDTKTLWTASLALWGTYDCMVVGMGEKCGADNTGPSGPCLSEWVENTRGLKLDTADPSGGVGVCKLGADIKVAYGTTSTYDATTEYCPVFSGWSDEKLAECIGFWRTRGIAVATYSVGASLNTSAYYDWTPTFPLKRTAADGNAMLYNVGIQGNKGYVDCIETTRKLCDEDDSDGMHCWLQGIAYDFWSQYVTLFETASTVAGYAGAAGFVISFVFLAVSFLADGRLKASVGGKICAALFGSFIILLLCAMSIVTVFGITTLAGSSFTILLLTSVLTAIGFSVEFAVHIVHRFLTAPRSCESSIDRVNFAMELLSLPMGCGCAASVVGLMCMLSTDSILVRKVFFLPLILVQVVTFFFGTLFLPSVLAFIPCACLQIGPDEQETTKEEPRQRAIPTILAASPTERKEEPRASNASGGTIGI